MSSLQIIRSQPSVPEPIVFREIKINGKDQTVPETFFRKKIFQINFICTMFALTLVLLISLMTFQASNDHYDHQTNALPSLVGFCIYTLCITILTLVYKDRMGNKAVYSVIFVTTYLILLTILYASEARYQKVIAIFFSAVQFIYICNFAPQRYQRMFWIVWGIQQIMLSFQLDRIYQISWNIIVLPTFLCLLALTFYSIYLFISKISNIGSISELQSLRINYKALLIIDLVLIIANILIRICFLSTWIPFGISFCIYNLILLIILLVFQKEELALAITLHLKDQWPVQDNYISKNEKMMFTKMSDSWFVLMNQTNNSTTSSKKLKDLEELKGQTECLLCLDTKASLIWMPCGHLTTCQPCGLQLIKDNRVSCLLCKGASSSCCRLQVSSNLPQKPEYKSQITYKINLK